MSKKQDLIDYIIDNEFIEKPSLQDKFVKLLNSAILESVKIFKLSGRFSDPNFIDNVILSYRHDFGLLKKEEQDKLRFECKQWMIAIKNNEGSF